MIYLADTPIGYMRWQTADVAALEEIGLSGIPQGAVDMDILIGEPNLIGRGIATVEAPDGEAHASSSMISTVTFSLV